VTSTSEGDDGSDGATSMIDAAYGLETREQTLAHYEAWADSYDREVGEDLGYAQPARCAAALAAVVRSVGGTPGGRLLDVGCGTGLSGLAFRDAGFSDQDGCDFSPPMLEKAAATGAYRRLFEADLNEGLDVDDAAYDHAAAVGVYSFGQVGADTLREVLRVVRPGGTVVIGLNDHFWDEGGVPTELDAIEADGLATVEFREHGDHLPGADIGGWVVVLVTRGRAASRTGP